MYCPVDGDEFREGITQCPEHDVALVEEPPELEEPPPALPALDEHFGMRAAFFVAVAGALLYAGFGFAQDAVVAWAYLGSGDVPDISWAQALQAAGFALGLGAFGILASALAFRTYQRVSPNLVHHPKAVYDERGWAYRVTGRASMRFLFTLVILFSLVWMIAGVATSHENGKYRADPFAYTQGEQPTDRTVALFSLRDASFVCAIGTFGIMAAALMMRAHGFLVSSDEDVESDEDAGPS